MFNINFSDDWIRTSDLWNWKWPLYQLSHNHCPYIMEVKANRIFNKRRNFWDQTQPNLSWRLWIHYLYESWFRLNDSWLSLYEDQTLMLFRSQQTLFDFVFAILHTSKPTLQSINKNYFYTYGSPLASFVYFEAIFQDKNCWLSVGFELGSSEWKGSTPRRLN